MAYKHVYIRKHPVLGCWMVVGVTFPQFPLFLGTLIECKHAAVDMEKHAQEMVDKNKQQ